MDYLEKGSTSNEHPDSAYDMPGTELGAPAHRHRSAGTHLTHLLDHESPPGPRRPPESSPSSPGRSSSASDHRASRLSAALSRAGSVTCCAAGFLVAVAAFLVLPLQAQAQTVQTLVSNTGQDRDNSNLNVGGSTGWVQAQGFTTGDNTDGYTLSSVDVFFRVGFGSTDEVTVSIYGADASGDPGSSLYVLNNPSSIPNANQIISFAAPPNTTLAHGTNYFVVVEAPAGAFFLAGTDFDDEDSGNASGWSIHDTRSVNSQTATDWSEWEVALLIAVKGTVNGGPTLSTDATLSALTLSGVTLDQNFAPATQDDTATVVNSVMATTVTATTTHSGATVAFKDGADNPLTNPVTLDVGDNVIKAVVTAEDLTTMKTYMVTVTRAGATDICLAPTFTGRTEVWRGTITLGTDPVDPVSFGYFHDAGDVFGALSDPDNFDYGGNNYTIEGIVEYVSSVSVNTLDFDLDSFLPGSDQNKLRLHLCGDTFDLTAASKISDMGTYRWTDAVLDWSGATTIEAALSGSPPAIVTGGVQVTSMAAADQTYRLGETIEITVTFDNAVTVNTSGGTPRIELLLGSGNKWAEYSSGSGGTALEFTYDVQSGDMDDDGISIEADRLQLRGGTITAAADNAVNAFVYYDALGVQPDHKVDGSTVPGAPTGLTATASGTTTIDLSWTAPADNGGSAITGYRIEVSSDGGSSWTDREANTGTTSTTYSHTGLSAGTTRYYRVSAINSVGTGAASNVDDATTDDAAPTVPGAPTSLTATASGTSTIDLSWTAPADEGGSAITGYKIEVSPNGDSNWTNRVANTGTTSTTYSHTGLSAGTTRHYRVSAINANGTGAASNVDDATTDDAAATVPGAPTGLTATASGTTTIDLSWTAPADNGGSAITGYKIEVSSDGGSSWTDREANTGTTTTTYAHTGLSAGTTRYYRVSAINSVGTGAASNVDNATTDDAAPTVPGAPTSLTATASGTSTIDLSWTAPSSDGGSAITGYKIEVSPNGDSNWTNRVANTGTTSTTYAHTGLSAGTTRHYRVSAINANGTGAASNVDNATTDAAATTVPGAPTSLTATADGTSTINLSWTAPADDGGSAITGYRIEVSPNGTSSWTNRVADTGTTSTSYSHTGLSAGTTRHYRVSAINANGTGTASSTDNATTGTTTDPEQPLVLTVEAVEDEITEGEPVRYRILMSRRTSGAVVQSSFSYKGDFVRNPNSVVTSGINSHGGRLSWVVSYETLDDVVDEPNGKFTVTIRKPDRTLTGGADLYSHGEAYTVGSPSSATVTIMDNDPEDTPTLPIVSVEDARVKEGPDAELVFPARLNVAPVETARIHWQTLDGANSTGAKAGEDYVGASGTLVFSPGETEKTIRVEVLDDTQVEGTEVMLLYLSGAENAVIDDALMKGTIEDNDAASAAAEGLTPDEAADALFGERRLSEARLAALDRLGNGNGRYDLGDLLSWIERCRRGEARCGPTSTGSGPPSAAGLLAAAAAGRPWISRHTRRRGSGRPGRKPIRAARRRGRFAGYALATLLAVTMTLSCTEGSVGPAAYVPDPGFLTVEWSGPAAGRGIGVLLELEGPGIEAVRAPGFELYESRASGRHEIVVAGSLRAGPLVQFRVPDRGQLPLYRVRVLEVAGEDYELRDAGEYRAVITLH